MLHPEEYRAKYVPRLESLDVLAEMFDNLNEIRSYAEGLERVDFMTNREKQAAIMYRLIRGGEAAKVFCDLHEGKERKQKGGPRMSATNADITKVSLSEEQWKDLHSLRDFLAHNIGFGDHERVWAFVTDEVPRVLEVLLPMMGHYTLKQMSDLRTPGQVQATIAVMDQFFTNLVPNMEALGDAIESQVEKMEREGIELPESVKTALEQMRQARSTS